MAITLKKKPEIDLYGTRWLHLKLDEQGHLSPCDVEAEADLSLLVGSTGDPLFQSHHAMINRHMQAIDAQAGVGTSQFSPLTLADVQFDNIDNLLIGLVARHIIKDWKGVQDEAAPGVPADYTPERGQALMRQHPDAYWLALKTGTDIAVRADLRTQETVGKS
ncbi:hypothetical protein ACRS2Z_28340 [Pseudomonas aeruginosa]|uniref:hypothetical protein n=1 Tax=Pseudomonas aeruginosa TaxID=287 RepID=UPI003EE2FED3